MTITLKQGSTNVATTTTTANGAYSFANVWPGSYTVVQTLPAGYLNTLDSAGTTNEQIPVTLVSGTASTGNNYWDAQYGTISGVVRIDVNGDGIVEAGDTNGLAGVTVTLLQGTNVIATTTTGPNGAYSFANVPPGTYTVVQTDPTHYTTTVDSAGTGNNQIPVTLLSGGTLTNDNYYDAEPGTISGAVLVDVNGDGIAEAGDTNGLAGVTITLKQGSTVVATTTTAANGAYNFANVVPGSYTVVQTLPAGYLNTLDSAGTTNEQIPVTLASGTASTGNNYWDAQYGTISGVVRIDVNGDGIVEAGDTNGLAGVTVTLLQGTNVIATTTTGPNGAYSFANVPPGTYTVVQTDPTHYTTTVDSAGTGNNQIPVTLLSGGTLTNDNYYDAEPGTISGAVLVDVNGDGIAEAGDTNGLAGVTITLKQGSTNVATTTTAANGTYSFANVWPGSYTVVQTLPAGYLNTLDSAGTTNEQIAVTLQSGGSAAGNNYWDAQYAGISGSVLVDVNGDGIAEAGDTNGIAGVTITLKQGSTVIATTTTAANGAYNFANVVPGSYTVVQTLPAGYLNTLDSAGTTNEQIPVTLASGATSANNNYWDAHYGSVSGVVRLDVNGDGVAEAGDTNGLAGVTVQLLDTNGVVIATTTTDANGAYSFANVPPGNYTVVQTDPAHYTTTLDSAGTTNNQIPVTLLSGGTLNENYYDAQPGTVSGSVFVDQNGDGIAQAGDTNGIAGITITLQQGSTVIATTTTAANGAYTFANVWPGSYTVVQTLPAGYLNTLDSAGTTNEQIPVTLTSGSTSAGNNYYDAQYASISGSVFVDVNGNGVADTGDTNGLAGVTVQLLDTNGVVIATTTTDANGVYSFANVPPGSYTVVQTDPAHYTTTLDSAGTTNNQIPVTLLSGGTLNNANYYDAQPGTVSGAVFVDVNGDGIVEPGDTNGLAGVTVQLLDTNGVVIATTTTDANGVYSFANVPPGSYTVVQTDPAHYTTTLDSAGTTNNQIPVTLLSGGTLNENYYDFSPSTNVPQANVTLTKCAVPVTTYPNNWCVPISKGQQFVAGDYWLRLEYGAPSFDVWSVGNLESGVTNDVHWHHVVGRFTCNPTNSWGPHTSEILVDGVVVATRSATGTPVPSTAALMLGAYLGNSDFYAGLMDEVRLSGVARNNAWLQTSYAQQQNPGAFLTLGAEGPSGLPGCIHQHALTINGALVQGNLTNFPVLVSVTDDTLRTGVACSNGADIVFCDANNIPLAHEIESFCQAAGRLTAWVRLPSLAAGVNTTFSIHYGNPTPGAPAYPPSTVWDANFKMVQHLNTVTGIVCDSTVNGNTGIVHGATATPFGTAGGACAFNGINQYIEIPNSPSLQVNTHSFTVEGWFCRKSADADALFNVTVTNAGPDTALNLAVSDVLDSHCALEQSLASQGVYTPASGIWQVGDLPAGTSASLLLALKLNGISALTNTAAVLSCDSVGLDGYPAGYGQQASAIAGSSGDGSSGNGQPDFTISALTTTPATLTAGGTFSATVTVLNQGLAAGNAGTLRLWLNHFANATVGEPGDAQQSVGVLAAGASTTLTFAGLTATNGTGTYTLRAFVDADNITAEQSEGNNQQTLTYTFASSGAAEKPDFVVTAIATTPSTLTKGGAFSATVTVLNQGLAAGNAGTLRLWLNHFANATVGEPGDRAQSVGVLAVGASTTLTFAGLTAPNADGTYNLRAFVDADNVTVEQSEGNNQKTLTYTFAPTSGSGSGGSGGSGSGGSGSGGSGSGYVEQPDFIVTDISFSPGTLTNGCTFTAYVTIMNNGPAAGDAGTLTVWVDHYTMAVAPVGTDGDASQPIGVMQPGEVQQIIFTGLTAPAAFGTHTFRAFIDSQGITAEQSEGNNQTTRTYGYYH